MIDETFQKLTGAERPCGNSRLAFTDWKPFRVGFRCPSPIPKERQDPRADEHLDDRPTVRQPGKRPGDRSPFRCSSL